MTVPSTRFREDYAGNGSATSFPYAFRIFKAADLVVTKTDSSGTDTTLTLGTDYTVTGAGSYNGGAVVLTTALPTSYRLTIERVLSIKQETDLRNQGEFLAETHEDAFDRLTMIVQRLAGYLGMGQGGTLRTLLLGTGDVDGAGAFRARGNRISGLGDPVDDADAAGKRWTQEQIASAVNVDGSSMLGVFAITVDTIAGASGLLWPDKATVIARGRDTVGDGGGGPLRFLKGSTATANDVAIYAVTGGRLVREGWSVFGIDVRWAGAKGDGATDDTAAIQAALTCAGTKKCSVYVPGTVSAYKITDKFTVPDGVTVHGDGWGSLIQQTSLNKDVFTAGNSNVFRNLRLKIADGNNADFVNCIYASAVNNLTVESCFLELGDLGGCGVHVRAVQNSKIRGNSIYGGKWTGAVAGPAASAADILLYSSTASERHIIEGNYCLSNNSQGIFVDALGANGDIIISNNICVTLDPSTCTETGAWSLAANGGVRRHGIVVGYNSSSVSGPRTIINGNICRNTRWTGIYKQGVSSGAVIISNNLCDLNGYEAGNPLAGGIYLTQSGYELVVDNEITNFQSTIAGDTGSITVASASTVTVPCEIRANKIVGSVGYGLVLKTQSAYVVADSNSFVGCANSDIAWIPSSGLTTVGGHRITNNVITRSTSTLKPAISLSIQSSTLYTLVKDNIIRGDNNTTNDVNNAAIRRTGSDAYIQIIGNTISNFYYGVIGANYWTGGRMSDVLFEGNIFRDCNTGFALGATSGAQTVPLVGNRFINVTTQSAGALGGAPAGRIVTRQGDNFVWQATATPTLGTWAVGDRALNSAPAVGQPKGWICIGTPGTWVSEGNL